MNVIFQVLTVVDSDLGNNQGCTIAKAEALLWRVFDDNIREGSGRLDPRKIKVSLING